MWSSASQPKALIPASRLSPPDGNGIGLKGEYYEDRTMKKLIMTRTDPVIDFDWAKANPFPANNSGIPVVLSLQLPAGNYRAEWLDPRNGHITKREGFKHGGGSRSLAAPIFTEDAALKLTNRE
jgi:hypothetical protein